jgi:hypothetical protein
MAKQSSDMGHRILLNTKKHPGQIQMQGSHDREATDTELHPNMNREDVFSLSSSWKFCHLLPEGKEEVPLPGQTSEFLLNNSSIQASMEYKQLLPHIPQAEALKRALIFPIQSSNLMVMRTTYHSPEKTQACPSHNPTFLLKTIMNP